MIGGTTYPINTIVGLDTAGNFLFKFGHNTTYPDPYYEAPPTPTVFPSQINITGGAWVNNIFNLDVSKSTTTSKYYELNTYTNNGFEFRNEAGNTVVYPNTDDNTGQPNYVSFSNPITSDSRFGVSSIESLTLTSSDVGSTLHLYASHDNSLWMSFVVSTDLIFTYEAPCLPNRDISRFRIHIRNMERIRIYRSY